MARGKEKPVTSDDLLKPYYKAEKARIKKLAEYLEKNLSVLECEEDNALIIYWKHKEANFNDKYFEMSSDIDKFYQEK